MLRLDLGTWGIWCDSSECLEGLQDIEVEGSVGRMME
jgi:hypothetical protein